MKNSNYFNCLLSAKRNDSDLRIVLTAVISKGIYVLRPCGTSFNFAVLSFAVRRWAFKEKASWMMKAKLRPRTSFFNDFRLHGKAAGYYTLYYTVDRKEANLMYFSLKTSCKSQYVHIL